MYHWLKDPHPGKTLPWDLKAVPPAKNQAPVLPKTPAPKPGLVR